MKATDEFVIKVPNDEVPQKRITENQKQLMPDGRCKGLEVRLKASKRKHNGFLAGKIARISKTFERDPKVTRQSILIATTVKRARVYEIGYCQKDREIKADYLDYVYDNSFARLRRRKR